MKVNTKVIALMTALAAGVAGAQNTATDGTKANTDILNVATATFTDPANPGTPTSPNTLTSTSNEVKTTVLPKPGFDIVYSGGTDGTEGSTAGGNAASTAQSTGTVIQGGSLPTAYKVVNNGNTDQTITLGYNTTNDLSTAGTGTSTVLYYIDSDGDGILSATEKAAGSVTSISLPYNNPTTTEDEGVVSIIQVLTVPADAAPGKTYAATPVGTGQGFDGSAPVSQTETTEVLGLQYATATIYTPTLTNNPSGSTNDGATTTVTSTVTPPGTTTPVTGYTDPSGTLIAISGDEQIAYPKADGNSTADVVTFTNTVKNGGTLDDTVNLFPTDSTGKPIGTVDANGVFSNIPGLPAGTTVQFTDMSGNPLPIGADGYPVLTVTAGGTANYKTVVTYPDTYTTGSQDTSNPGPITVLVGVDSSNDAGVVADQTTKDTIYPPAAQFGDTTTDPTTADPTLTPNKNGAPGATVTFPMDLVNNGEYKDSYTLAGTVTFPTVGGGTTTVDVVYYVDTDGDGVLSDAEKAAGPVTSVTLDKNSATDLIAAVTIPSNAAATLSTDPKPTLNQTATGVYSTIVMEDKNDTITVTPAGNVYVAKFTLLTGATTNTMYVAGTTCTTGAPTISTTNNQIGNPTDYTCANTTYLPGVPYSYQIIGKNTYNSAISNFVLSDDLTDKPFKDVSGSCSTGGTFAFANNIATCTYTSLAAYSSATMTVNVTIK